MGNPQLEDLDDLDDVTTGARIEAEDTGREDGFADDEVSLEELDESLREEERDAEMAVGGPIDTQHSDGSAYYPLEAQQQGLVYIPPDDPPVLPSDDLQQVEMAAGFGKDVEFEDPRARRSPDRLKGNDWDLQAEIMSILHKSSLTNQMTDVQVRVRNGVAHLSGAVETLDDVDVVCSVVQTAPGITDVQEELIVTSL